MIYLSDTTELRNTTDFIFVSEYGSFKVKPLTLSSVNSLFEHLEKKCSISGHSNMLRHYFSNEKEKAVWYLAQDPTYLSHKILLL